MEIILFYLLVVLCFLDVVSTNEGLKCKYAWERNLGLKTLMDKIGVLPALVLSKTVFLIIVYFLLLNTFFLAVANIATFAVLVNNCFVLNQIRKLNALIKE